MEKFEKPATCNYWVTESSQWLKEASFLSIEPVGSLCDDSGIMCDVLTQALEAHSWSIIANFPLKPYWVVAGFPTKWRDHAFQALLNWRQTRPIFYQEPGETIELHGDSVHSVLEEIRSKGVLLEEEDTVST